MPDIKQCTVISPTAKIGAYSIVWSFTTICAFVEIGDYCVIGSNCFIGTGSIIGESCRLQTGVFLPNRSLLGKNVFLGPHVVCTDDKYPRVNNHNYTAEPPVFEDGCSVGAGVVILPGTVIGKGAMVGAGAVVTRNVEAGTTVAGLPARLNFGTIREEIYEHRG